MFERKAVREREIENQKRALGGGGILSQESKEIVNAENRIFPEIGQQSTIIDNDAALFP
jgi:hypothetical protein